MRIYFNDTLCKKCPFGHLKKCLYKKLFYRYVLPPYSKLKLIHKCEYYQKIFFRGQLVVIDLYHRIKRADGRCDYVMAKKNVVGTIAGARGAKYIIDLLEPSFLQRKNKVKVFLQAHQHAKMIRPVDIERYDVDYPRGIEVESASLSLPSN